MYKRFLAIIMSCVLIFSLAACGGKKNTNKDNVNDDTEANLTLPSEDEKTDNSGDVITEPDNTSDSSGDAETNGASEKDKNEVDKDKPEQKPVSKPASKPQGKPPVTSPSLPPAAQLPAQGTGEADKKPDTQNPPVSPDDAPSDSGKADSPLSLLEKIWNAYPEDSKFAVSGGDYENSVMDAPGKFGLSNTQTLDSILGVPESSASMIDDAASLMHMMNANTFTAGAYHIKSGESADDFTSALKEHIMSRQWVCGFPDKLVIYTVGDYVISAFGKQEIIDEFSSVLTSVDSNAALVFDESLN